MKRKKKLWLIPVIVVPVLIIVIVAGVLISKAVMKGLSQNGVELVSVEERDLSDTLTLKGTLSGETVTKVPSKITAEVTELNVLVGDEVKKGDIICILDSADIEKKLEQANASLNNNNALSNLQAIENNKRLTNAQIDQVIELQDAQISIDRTQEAYDKAVKDVNDNLDKKNKSQSSLNVLKNAVKKTGDELVKAYNEYVTEENAQNSTALSEAATVADVPQPQGGESYEEAYNKYQAANSKYVQEEPGLSATIRSCQVNEAGLAEVRDTLGQKLEDSKRYYNEKKIASDRQIESVKSSIEQGKYTSDNDRYKEEVENLEKQYDNCVIVSPVDGIVTAVNISVGDIVMAEQSVVTIEDSDNMKLVLTVDEKNILKLSEGMSAIITNDYMPDNEIKGAISRVVKVKNAADPVAQTAGGYRVEISFKNNGDFLLGMSGKAKITLNKREAGLAVPYDLVRKDEDGNSYVLIAKDNGNGTYTAHKEVFTPGDEIEYYVEVKEGNIKTGDLIPNNPMIQDGATFPGKKDYFLTEGDKK